MCASNESENWYKVESCSTGVMLSHSACVETCGTGVVTIGDMGAVGELRVNLFFGRRRVLDRIPSLLVVWLSCRVARGTYSLAFELSVGAADVGFGPSPVMQPRTVGCVNLCAGCVVNE